MKRIIISLLIVGHFSNYAQVDPHPFNIEPLLAPLNKAEVGSKILYDNTVHFSDFKNYVPNADKVASFDVWKQVYLELYNSHLNKTGISSLDDVKEQISAQIAANGVYPLLVLDYDYDFIDSLALQDSLIGIDSEGKFYDIVGRSRSPYLQQRIVLFSPSFRSAQFDTIRFVINQEHFYTNRSEQPVALRVDFGDGKGLVSMSWGVAHTVVYPDATYRELTMEIDYDNGETITLKSAKEESPCFDMPPAPDYVETLEAQIPYLGKKAKIDIYVRSAAGKGTKQFWDRPVIFVEGLNFDKEDGDTEKWKYGTLGWCAFWGNSTLNPEFDDSPELLDDLVAEGYDIIFVDFHDGADYIQRNAFALVWLLQTLNGVKQAGPSVIIGPSMGGQISRYALTYMEQNNIPHCSRLWISVDSPHQGANVPLGLQYFIDFFAHNGIDMLNAQFIENVENINRPAPKQLLSNHYVNYNYQFSNTPNDAKQIHTDYYNEIGNLGYPKQTRNIGMSSGSRTAVTIRKDDGQTAVKPGEQAVEFILRGIVPNILCQIGADGQLAVGHIYTDGTKFGAPLVTNPNSIGLLFSGRAQKNLTSAILCTSLPYPLCIPCIELLSEVSYKVSNTSELSYDVMPGGKRDSFGVIQKGVEAGGTASNLLTNVTTYFSNHSFIPLKSGLDLNDSFGWFDDVENLVNNPNEAQRNTPFEKLWAAPGDNEIHVEITAANADWVIGEILAGEPGLGTTLATRYNFARPENRLLLADLDILSGGALHVNGNFLSDFGYNPNNRTTAIVPQTGSTFTLTTSGCMGLLKVNNNGKVVLGDANGNKGILHITKGVVMSLESGSLLEIHPDSRLVIEEGATLRIKQGANIKLYGDESLLDIQGLIEFYGDVNIQLTPTTGGKGYIKLGYPEKATPAVSVIGGAKVTISGQHFDDKIIEMAGGEVKFTNGLSMLTIAKGLIEYTSTDASMVVSTADFLFDQTTFKGMAGTNNELYIFNNTNNPQFLKISNSYFDEATVNTKIKKSIRVYNCDFVRHSYLKSVDGGSELVNVNFTGEGISIPNEAAYTHRANTLPIVYNRGQLKNLESGINIIESNSTTSLKALTMNKVWNGVTQWQGSLEMGCNKLTNESLTWINFNEGLYFSMSELDNNGHNGTENKSSYHIQFSSDVLNIDNGYNDFRAWQGSSNQAFGRLIGNITTLNCNSNLMGYTLNGRRNLWFTETLQIGEGGIHIGGPKSPPKVDPNDPIISNNPNFQDPNKYPKTYPVLDVRTSYYGCSGGQAPPKIYLAVNPHIKSLSDISCSSGGINPPDHTPGNICAKCSLVEMPGHAKEKVNIVIQDIVKRMAITDLGGTLTSHQAIESLSAVFQKFTPKENNYDENFMAIYGYEKAKSALHDISSKERPDAGVIHQVRDINISLHRVITETNYTTQFHLLLDEALLYRLNEEYEESSRKLNAIKICYLNNNQRQILQNWKDIIQFDIDYRDEQISEKEYHTLVWQLPRIELPEVNFSETTTISEKASVHPTAKIGNNVRIEEGVFVGEKVVVGNNVVLKKDAQLKAYSIVGQNSIIGEQTVVEEWVEIGKNATIGKQNRILNGSYIAENVRAGDRVVFEANAVVKAGSVVSDDALVEGSVNGENIIYDCAFAISFAQNRGAFYNGFTIDKDVVIAGEPVEFSSKNLSESYSWKIQGEFVSSSQSFSYTFDKAGIYTINILLTNECGEEKLLVGSVSVMPAIWATLSALQVDCSKEVLTTLVLKNRGFEEISGGCNLENLNKNNMRVRTEITYDFGQAETFIYEFDNINWELPQGVYSRQYNDFGNYRLGVKTNLEIKLPTQTNWELVTTQESYQDISVKGVSPDFMLIPSQDCLPSELLLYDNTNETITSREWFLEGRSLGGLQSFQTMINSPSEIELVITDQSGCVSSIKKQIELPECASAMVNQEGYVITKKSYVANGENRLEKDEMYIYPNPTGKEITINLPEQTNYVLQLTGITGQIVFETRVTNTSNYVLNISHLENGIYFIKATNSEAQYIERIVLQK